jgi:hypothetical protein
MYNVTAYIIYLFIALITVFGVGRILFRNGRFFLVEVFHSEHIADNINRVLYVGYCLVNSGCAFYHLNTCSTLDTIQQLVEFIISSTGQLYLIIGFMHYFNLILVPRLNTLFNYNNQNIKP